MGSHFHVMPHSRHKYIFTQFLLLIFPFIIQSEYFTCSDEFALDWELYGACIPDTRGRFTIHLEASDLIPIHNIAKIIENNVNIENQTVAVADLVSETVIVGKTVQQLQTDTYFRRLTSQLLENVGNQIRGLVQELFDINAKLWISSPILLS